jgi:hypothetical protein
MWFLIFVLTLIAIIWWCRRPTSYWIDPKNSEFFEIASDILKKSKWRDHHRLQQTTSPDANIHIHLTPDEDISYPRKFYPSTSKPIKYSTTTFSDPIRIDINASNWQGVPESGLNLQQYRTYVLEHELGHALGYDHTKCDQSTVGSGGRCPVMYQSTTGCGDFKCGFLPSHGNFNPKSAPKIGEKNEQ